MRCHICAASAGCSGCAPTSTPLDAGTVDDNTIPIDLATVVVIEGISQLNQFAVNWQTYRATAESLKHEKYLYLAHAGPYAGSADGTALLADRIEGLISQEHAKWVSAREEADRALPGAEQK